VISDILEAGMPRFRWSCVVLLGLVLVALPRVAAARGNDAKELYEQATAAFGLGRYAEAAQKYEEAFSHKPDPALLYNAAQAYRLAGNRPRALELYRNCLRLFPNFANAEDARGHVANLKREIEDEQVALTAPPPAPAAPVAPVAAVSPPAGSSPIATAPTPAAASPAGAAPPALIDAPAATVTTTPAPEEDRSIFKKGWFWAAVGAVVVGGTVGILLATRGTKYPDATFGTANGN
jgi:tetratricopeptide (TPR) repeat protein